MMYSLSMNATQISPTVLSTIAAILLSLVFSYVRGAKNAFDKLDGTAKRLYMLLALAITTGVTFTLACWPAVKDVVPIQCTQPGAIALITAFIQAVIANQATYLISPKPQPMLYKPTIDDNRPF